MERNRKQETEQSSKTFGEKGLFVKVVRLSRVSSEPIKRRQQKERFRLEMKIEFFY